MNGLSVLTLVKNRAVHLDRLIEGLNRSAFRPLELVVVDMSEAALSPITTEGFPTTIVRLSTDGLPLAAARNLAARHAIGERFLFLDVDCIPARGLAGRIDDALKARDVVACAEVKYLAANAVDDNWSEAGLDAVAEPHPVRDFPRSGQRVETNSGLFWSLTFGVRRSTFEALEGFDEKFEGYGAEDTDFGFRCREAGLPLIFLGGPGSFHQHHGVYDPPLQHFDDILRNAATFQSRWGVLPMEGWLSAFEARGLIIVEGSVVTRLRSPTANEIVSARQAPSVRF